jgi:hypothetical protein
MTTFTTEDRILAEKDGSFTINVEGGTVTTGFKDLTDKEIMDLWVKHLIDDIHVFARAVLKKAQEK